jgi:hypothetical protein
MQPMIWYGDLVRLAAKELLNDDTAKMCGFEKKPEEPEENHISTNEESINEE